MEKPNKSQQGRNPGNGGQRGIPGTSGPNPNNTWLNRFPAKDSVSTTLSPRTIVWGDSPDFNVDCRSKFGSYCEVYESRTSTNSTAARTVEAIALYPSGNSQGGYRFLLLNTGRLVTRNQWTKLPIPLSAVDVIASLAKKDKQPDISKHGYIFSWARIKNFHNTDLSSVQQTSDEEAKTLTSTLMTTHHMTRTPTAPVTTKLCKPTRTPTAIALTTIQQFSLTLTTVMIILLTQTIFMTMKAPKVIQRTKERRRKIQHLKMKERRTKMKIRKKRKMTIQMKVTKRIKER